MTKFWSIWGATIIWLLTMVGGAIWHVTRVEVRFARIESRLEMLLYLQTTDRPALHPLQTSATHGQK